MKSVSAYTLIFCTERLGEKYTESQLFLLSEGSDDTVEDIHALSPALTKNGSLLHEARSVPSARTVMTHV